MSTIHWIALKLCWLPLLGIGVAIYYIIETFNRIASAPSQPEPAELAEGISSALSKCLVVLDTHGVILLIGILAGFALQQEVRRTCTTRSEKPFWLVFLAALLLGSLGIHCFLVRRYGDGVVRALTLGGLGVLTACDLLLLSAGRFRDAAGELILRPGVPRETATT